MRTEQKVQVHYIESNFAFDIVHEHDVLHGVDRILILFHDHNGHQTYAFNDNNISIGECIRIINSSLKYNMNVDNIHNIYSQEDTNDIQRLMEKKVRDINVLQFDI